ncbi:Precorrin-2 dehydrogenase [compost metagenome]
MKRGRLTIAVSTLGAGPIVATNICNFLAEQYDEDYELYLEFLYRMRTEIKKKVPSPEQRGKLLKKLSQYDILTDIHQGIYQEWSEAQIQRWITNNEED